MPLPVLSPLSVKVPLAGVSDAFLLTALLASVPTSFSSRTTAPDAIEGLSDDAECAQSATIATLTTLLAA